MKWNVETLKHAVDEVVGADTAAVSWADDDGNAVYRTSWPGRKGPPQLAVGACLHGDAEDVERRLRELPGFVRLVGRDDEDADGEPYRVVRAVFARAS